MSADNAATTATTPSGGMYFVIGPLLAVAGIVLYGIQLLVLRQVVVPWYIPLFTTAGVLCLALALWRRRTLVRFATLGLLALLCGFEWFALTTLVRLPEYTGPARSGAKLPYFETTLADGRPFTGRDLEAGQTTILVFFRGRW